MIRTPRIFDGYHGDNVTSFNNMAKAGILLSIFKSSQGLEMTDKKFQEHIDRAQSVGMHVGAYHFGGAGDGTRQAKRFLSLLEPGTLMVLDIERYAPSQMSVAEAEAFVLEVYKRTGVYVVLYYGEWLLEQEKAGRIADKSILRKCKAWVSRYSDKQPEIIKGHDLVMWQFTGDGDGPQPHKIAGCKNNADLSYWIGNEADIPRFVKKYSYPGASA